MAEKLFRNKRVYIHLKSPSSANRASEYIKLFGGSVEQFLDNEIDYVLTDIPKDLWPPNGDDEQLNTAMRCMAKLLSYKDLIIYCSKYLRATSSSDDDDETITQLKEPSIKFEDVEHKYQPVAKHFSCWPELNLNASVNSSIFSENIAADKQTSSIPGNGTAGTTGKTSVRTKKSKFYCDICCIKVIDTIEGHENSEKHKESLKRFDWGDVESVIGSLPSLSTMNRRPIHRICHDKKDEEFFCLHNVEPMSSYSWVLGSLKDQPVSK